MEKSFLVMCNRVKQNKGTVSLGFQKYPSETVPLFWHHPYCERSEEMQRKQRNSKGFKNFYKNFVLTLSRFVFSSSSTTSIILVACRSL